MAADPYQYFRIEARELVDALVAGVLDLENGVPTAAAASALLRHAHTLKGAARVVKQPEIADHAHGIEELLEPFRSASDAVPRADLDAVLERVDAIAERVVALTAPGADPAASAEPARASTTTRTIRTDVEELDVVINGLGETHTQLGLLRRDFATIDRARALLDDIVLHLVGLSKGGTDADRARVHERAKRTTDELRRAFGALELGVENGVERVERELRQTREAAERIRLVPAGVVFTDLERAVRDVARAQGKDVAFEGIGDEVRLDANVLETAQLALQQIVRNAVAHGIETAAERVAAGKPARGRVRVTISRRDQRVVFTCDDDGRGIDLEAVRAVARAKGIVTDTADALDSRRLLQLLLGGGLSTATAVTELSGRGIGLDVVRDSAARLGGEARATTTAGVGTTIELDVPLSIAAIDVLAVESGGLEALLPLAAVARTLRVGADAIQPGPSGDQIAVDDAMVPYVSLAAVLNGGPGASDAASGLVVVVSAAGGLAAVGVDRLLETATIIVRPLPPAVASSPIVTGTGLGADGRPRLVLAPDGLLSEARRDRPRSPRAPDTHPRDPILVVDDSLTTRMLEQSILESAGYAVEVATSAEEALTVARGASFSLFLVDVEMPGMDGFTFVAQTRADAGLRSTPAILVSSRNAPEDLQRGFDAGASAYITKGEFDQGVLLERVRELTAVSS